MVYILPQLMYYVCRRGILCNDRMRSIEFICLHLCFDCVLCLCISLRHELMDQALCVLPVNHPGQSSQLT